MSSQINTRLVSVFVIVVFGSVSCINIDFDDHKDGFFLKSTYHKFKPSEPNIVKESLILTHPAEVYKLRASYGPFETYQSVPNDVLGRVVQYGEDVWDKSTSTMHRQVIHNMDVSAHVVGSREIWQNNPVVQLLVHARPLVRRQKQRLIYSYYGYSQQWCAQVVVTKGDDKFYGGCVLGEKDNACVASIHLPERWWNVNKSFGIPQFSADNSSKSWLAASDREVLVYYDLSGVEESQECASVSNTIVAAKKPHTNSEKFITAVHLMHDPPVALMERGVQNLLFKIPVAVFSPRTKIEVPVFLDKSSFVNRYTVQVKVEGNVAIEGASTNVNSPWDVYFEAGDNQGKAVVTILLKADYDINKIDRFEEVMRWQFRTLASSKSNVVSKITWTVNPEGVGMSADPELYSEESELMVKMDVRSSRLTHLVPVIKERSLLNTAILSGKIISRELAVYTVAEDDSLREVTKDSYCRSLDPEAIKVNMMCNNVYLDGSESRGSQNVTIVVHFGSSMTTFSLRVWVPEPDLDIQLSDEKLSQVRRWKVQDGASSRQRRSTSQSLSNKTSQDNREKRCPLKYQQAMVVIYARFCISTPGLGTQYFRSKKTWMRVTSLVLNRTRVANPSVAKMYGQTVLGLAPGRTQVQILSPTGDLIGYKEIRVAKDKVEIERLMVRVISDMTVHIESMDHLPGALLATVYLRDQLVAKQQEAVLDIALEFKDGTMLPLSSINPDEYDLKITSVNNNIVEVTDVISSTITSMPPSIKAVGDGKGEIIKVTLKEKGGCDRRKPRNLDTEYVHVQVDFAKDQEYYNRVQSDGYYFNNRDHLSRNQQQQHYANKEEYFKQQKLQQERLHNSREINNKMPELISKEQEQNKYDSVTLGSPDVTQEHKTEALAQPVSTKAKHPTPLEVAMYVLVAVFVFAILVFTANCAVFMVRHQRKYKPHPSTFAGGAAPTKVVTGSISQAPDWVWIGRATLERQGVGSSGVGEPLMAEEDFNGNQMVVPNSTTSGIGSASISGVSAAASSRHSSASVRKSIAMSRSSSSGGCPATTASSGAGGSNRNSMVSTYQGSECSIRITANPLPEDNVPAEAEDLGGMGYNEAEWDYEAMGMTYEQLMDYFDNLKESSA